MRRSMFIFWITFSLAITLEAFAAPCDAPVFRHFDFLIGDWIVHSPDGSLQGENTISSEEGGCLLVERWRGSQGGAGQSYNYYQVDGNQWHQLWVSQGAIIEYAGGLNDDGAMALSGHIHYQANGQSAPFSGTWTPRDDGTVLQELKQWDAQSNTWQDWFIGTYSRKSTAKQ